MPLDNGDNDEATPGLLLTLEPVARRPLLRLTTPAAFLCQLLAARHHLPAQRLRRRASPGVATDAYADSAAIAIRRMPAGYRTSRLA